MTITKPWELLEDERIDAFNSGVRLIADANKQGTGKTFYWSKILMENNLNNIILPNTHAIMNDLYKYLDNIIDPSIKKMIFYPLFGRDYLLTSEEMGLYGMPKCLCNLYGDRLFNLRRFGLLYNNYCKLCKYRHECYHKKNNRELFDAVKNKFSNIPKLIMAPKSYTYTSLMDGILDKFDRINLILDEEILNMMYQQYDLTPTTINNYNKLVKKMISVDRSLKAGYKDFAPVFMAIDNALRYIGADEKNIIKSFMELKESNGINDCIEWNEKFKKSVLKSNYYGIGWAEEYHAFNIFNYIIKILEDGIKNGDFSRGISIDKGKETFSYFVNQIDRVREVVYKTYRTILTDSSNNRNFGPKFFPEFADSFKYLQNQVLKFKVQFKNTYISRMDNIKYGEYRKDTLINQRTHEVTNTFNRLALETKRIMLDEHENDNNIGLIISMKEVYNHLKRMLSPVALKNDMKVYFDYYFYLEGKNEYNNVLWIVLFGSCNIPQRVRDIMHNFWGISKEDLYFLFGPGEMIQGAHRGRDIFRPFIINLYIFGNIVRGYFNNEKSFYGILRLKYKKLLNYIAKQGGCELDEIMEFMGFGRDKVLKILKQLLDEGLLRYTLKKRARGRPHKIWVVK